MLGPVRNPNGAWEEEADGELKGFMQRPSLSPTTVHSVWSWIGLSSRAAQPMSLEFYSDPSSAALLIHLPAVLLFNIILQSIFHFLRLFRVGTRLSFLTHLPQC